MTPQKLLFGVGCSAFGVGRFPLLFLISHPFAAQIFTGFGRGTRSLTTIS